MQTIHLTKDLYPECIINWKTSIMWKQVIQLYNRKWCEQALFKNRNSNYQWIYENDDINYQRNVNQIYNDVSPQPS
jgi:hypothetical protein